MRIGQGFDVHAFGEGDHLVLGGINIPFDKGFKAHSDGDVLIHAIIDALLGAVGLGDIGQHFPDTDSTYRGISSVRLLEHVLDLVAEKGYRVENIDSTIVAQAPKMSPYIAKMRECLASVVGMPEGAVNVKATTTEKLGYTGRGEGIACYAVCLLVMK
ncbi:MAG: 2-C-methyl-D-erythritol 2,4-cyclodiphosphate synthase [Pseudomonadales bacterium]|nr:2-C-methyl-D-erythritol 2,4-cyclodiphosphate synthase [Pseudomonadales bacterium]